MIQDNTTERGSFKIVDNLGLQHALMELNPKTTYEFDLKSLDKPLFIKTECK